MTPILSSSFCKMAPHSVKLTRQKLSGSNHCHFPFLFFHPKKNTDYIMFDICFFSFTEVFETFLYKLSIKLLHFIFF